MAVARSGSTGRPKAQPVAHPDVPTSEQVAAAVTSFALLADPTRVRMLWALREAELDVASLAAMAGCRPTVASQHLSKLRFAGLVDGQRHGQRVIYRLRGAHVRALLSEALFQADHHVSGVPVHD
ncbi:MAG: metalloregulator ArsR/SmtB family transcription factor [Actinomycetota bacterium]|nr:metalloregulator ArsR/SmtB family transcription factor [Actinomycetota bacterium]